MSPMGSAASIPIDAQVQMRAHLRKLPGLEDLLAQEFRLYQDLHALTKDERQALAKNDVPALSVVVERKEAILDEMSQVAEARRAMVGELALGFGITAQFPTVADLSARLTPEMSGRLKRLREGILALAIDVRDLTRGNQSLALVSLERVDAVQTFILEILRPALSYQPPGRAIRPSEPGIAWDVDQRM